MLCVHWMKFELYTNYISIKLHRSLVGFLEKRCNGIIYFTISKCSKPIFAGLISKKQSMLIVK